MGRFGPITLFVAVTVALGPTHARAGDLGEYQWKHRLLLIFAPTRSDHRFMALDKPLSDKRAELQDRDTLVFRIFESGTSYAARRKMSLENAESLRRRFKAPSGEIRQILIGKDGGVKLTADEKTTLPSIFDLIDTMPMRRQEMRKKNKLQNNIDTD
jgi:hypothetical protein